ncbi:MAG: LysR substrate-binding domain-containing protein [Paracoccaceae bacterium]
MHLEIRHLRTVEAVARTGSIAAAADELCVTQSALSHQIKSIEAQTGVPILTRRTRPMRLSDAGRRILATAQRVLPEMAALGAEFDGLRQGSAGRLHVAIECHACFDWLLPVLDRFRRAWPDVDIDIRAGLAFDSIPALLREEVDVVISSDPDDRAATYLPLFDYAPVLVAPATDPLAARERVLAEDFAGRTLITYPVERARLDVFSQLLTPAAVEPASVRQAELTEVILMLVAAGRGVAVLPDWVMRQSRGTSGLITRTIGDPLVTRRLFAAVRPAEATVPYLSHLVRLAGREAARTGSLATAAGGV